MTPAQFIARWQSNKLTERAGAQAHFDDLCELLGVEKPRDADNYCFERGAKKSGGGDGWADVWKRGHFAWENKKPGRDLDKALKQLTDYSLQLESPPLLVVCDREHIIIHTAFTGYPDEPREIRIEDLVDDGNRQMLKWVFTDPLKLRPEKSTAAVTEEAAQRYAGLAEAMRQRGQDSNQVAHFLVQCLFSMFAEDEGLLPEKIFTRLLTAAKSDVAKATDRITKLFKAMREPKGEYGDDDIEWFNGGLFKQIAVPTLTATDLERLRAASADMDWRAIDPTIFGTLFERGLGTKRAALGAHYTDTGTIAKLVEPLVRDPLLLEWQAVREKIAKVAPKFGMVKTRGNKFRANEPLQQGQALYQGFLLRLADFRVLDPACGSGNFLYLALKALRDVEKRAQIEAQELGLQAEVSLQTGPHNILGLEINGFAAELARVTVWIGDIQWCRQNGWAHSLNPILKPLDGIEHRDALLDGDGTEAAWPRADAVVGNPPFIGDKRMRGELGGDYVETLRKAYADRVPGGADFVCYWFEKARAQIEAGQLQAAGLVSTNSIRGGANRTVLERIVETSRIFLAWSDEPWVNDGAAVRVSMVGFGEGQAAKLDNVVVPAIHADLTADIDITMAGSIADNLNRSFQGVTPRAEIKKKRRLELGLPCASFNLDGDEARIILREPANANSEPMSAVVRPYCVADEITTRPLDRFIVNFGVREKLDASLFERPFAALENVRLNRARMEDAQGYPWWQLWRPRPDMFAALKGLSRYISIPRHAKHYLCAWTNMAVVPGDALVVVARDDDTSIGILQSRIHEVWALRSGSSLEDRPRYTPTTCFETFPFPEGLSPNIPAAEYAADQNARAIATAAQGLIKLRDHYLSPPEWTDWAITPEEQSAGFPKRPVAKPGHEADLKRRTLTNLYNARPAWLTLAHEELDKAVAAAYGWNDYTPQWSDEDILRRLLALNQQRSNP
ncbi:N-6 DNA methylase [Variovorax sp. J2P1-59]|uniref:class I SAM-dependent DNA methyltransferase n=1 Tax=Variovorax flavidus TaxID=3053501 RepID=UPI002578F663|nr:DNA methyltransferase [Variovorax sp. J2P1-59]MDM0074428.1 N-6 DNA methylase [Variovorax sp. J2P1-59]